MKTLFSQYLKGDLVIWIITILFLALSIVTVYSFIPVLVKIEGGSPTHYLLKHMMYVIMGFGAMYMIHKVDPKYFSKVSKFGYYFAILLLIFTFFFGKEINGAGRWVSIPIVGLTFQSSDFAKLALFLYLSKLLVKKREKLNDWREGIWPLLVPIFVICALIFKDNLSTALLLFMLSMAVLFLGQVPFTKLMSMFGAGFLLIIIIIGLHNSLPGLNLLPRYDTWKNRITNNIETDQNIVENAQALDARRAIYNGQWFGTGVGDGKLKEYIPEAYADFYYASFVEEFGFISSVILVLLYLILLFRIIRIGLASKNLFETYVCLAIGLHLMAQASINILVCTGVFPITGQNMPFLAMGGSALIMACVSIGIVLAISAQQKNVLASEPTPAS